MGSAFRLQEIVFFKTTGTRFAIYPVKKLGEKFNGEFSSEVG